MKHRNILSYLLICLFVGWSLFIFRTDVSQIKFAIVWTSMDVVFYTLLFSLVNYALRAVRWWLYLSKLGYTISLKFSGLTYLSGFAFTLSPGKIGEIARGRYYRKLGVPLSSTTAAFFVERIMDMLAMLTLGFIAIASFSEYGSIICLSIIMITLILVILALFPWIKISKYIERGFWFPAWMKSISGDIVSTVLSAKMLLRPQVLFISFFLGLIAWGIEGAGLFLLGELSPNTPMDLVSAIGIYSIAIIVGAVSFLPGGLGSTEAVMIALLAAHGYSMPDAIMLTIVCRLLTLWLAVLIGWIAVAILSYDLIVEEAC
jgi:uncharacterized protein (TIRG00374 family)